MYGSKTCNWCGLTKEYEKQIEWCIHRGSCKFRPNRKESYLKLAKTLTKKKKFIKNCKKCGNEFEIWATEDGFKRNIRGIKQYCSSKCSHSITRHSEEYKRKLSEKMKGIRWGNADPSRNIPNRKGPRFEKTCPNCSKIFTVTPSGKSRIYCSRICASKSPKQGGFRLNSTRKHRSMYKGFQMDSGSELKFAKLLDINKIKWIKNTSRFFNYIGIDNKTHKYYPDFYLPDYDHWIEIKGRLYRNNNDELKLKSVGTNIELQLHDEIHVPEICKKFAVVV